jgi:hypothetical protein
MKPIAASDSTLLCLAAMRAARVQDLFAVLAYTGQWHTLDK